MSSLITLRAGDLALDLDATHGGAIAAFTDGAHDIFRAIITPALAAQQGARIACYPLVPYANRIGDGKFTWNGEPHVLAKNFGNHPHPLHGNGWMHSWKVVSRDQRAAVLRFDHLPADANDPEWPFAFSATQSFALSDTALIIGLSLTNTSAVRAPGGLGLHPLIARTPGTELTFAAEALWQCGPTMLPDVLRGIDEYADFSQGLALAGVDFFDTCFAGWPGEATVSWPERETRLRVSADPVFDHLHVFTPPGQDFFAIEPVTHMPNAINEVRNRQGRRDDTMRALAPGETLAGAVKFTVLRGA